MKMAWKEILFSLLLCLVVPGFILRMSQWHYINNAVTQVFPGETDGLHAENTLYICVYDGFQSRKMKMDDYLVGVLLSEIPEGFAEEAKKAQAVVARTYALRTALMKDKHAHNAVCTDPNCCQGYIAPAEYTGSQSGIESAYKAVSETGNQVITYNAELIDATYFSCSGGTTESAVAVWGADVPYLQSVSSPGEEDAEHYLDTETISASSFRRLMGKELEGNPLQWFGKTVYTAAGSVASVMIGDAVYSGTDLRNRLGLRSTAFTIAPSYDSVTITTRGFGHRVGMSQYGADAMAQSGSTYRQILSHYYQGISLEEYTVS